MNGSDRMQRWPSVIAVGIPMLLIVIRATPVGADFVYVVMGIPALLLIWLLAAVAALAMALRSLKARAWRRSLSRAILPLTVVAAFIQPRFSIASINLAGDLIHFEMVQSRYLAELATMPKTAEPKLVIFDWGGWITMSNGVVYDESDEVALPAGQRSPAWKARANDTELNCSAYAVRAIGDHFYLADFIC